METFSALLAICADNSPVPGEFPAQRPVMRSFDVLFDQRLNQLLSKQWWGWWFETLSRPLWRHRNDEVWIESSYVRENYTFVLYPAGDPIIQTLKSWRWRHNERDSVSNYQPHDFLLNRLFKRRSKKTLKRHFTGHRAEIHRGSVNSPHKWPVTRKMFPFDGVIMCWWINTYTNFVRYFRDFVTRSNS